MLYKNLILKNQQENLKRFRGLVGYGICLTRRTSPVRSWAKSFNFSNSSGVAQWKRSGLITHWSVDRNHPPLFFFDYLLITLSIFFFFHYQ